MAPLAANDRTRLLRVTAGNLRNNHLYITAHYDFFPADCFGPPRKPVPPDVHPIEILLDGLNEVVRTDISRDAATGRPRGIFRERKWVRRFYRYHGVNAGDELLFE